MRWLGNGLLLLALAASAPAASAAEVYRHVDKDGVVHYSDEPPTRGAKPVVLPPIQVIGPPGWDGPAPMPSAPADAGRPAPLGLSIVSPMPEQVFRGEDLRLDVSVQLDRALPEGHGLLYLLDGAAQNAQPTRALNFSLPALARGEHRLGVVTVDAAGREVARAAPVTIHVKPGAAAGGRARSTRPEERPSR